MTKFTTIYSSVTASVRRVQSSRLLTNKIVRPFVVPLSTILLVAAIVLAANLAGLETPVYVLALGTLIGISYGLLGVCTVLVFRVSGVVNLALPAIGVFALSFMPLLVQVLGMPWWVGFLCIIPIGFAVGAVTDMVVIRRVQAAPRVVGVIASLGVAGVLAAGAGFANTLAPSTFIPIPLPPPPGLPSFSIGPLAVIPGYTGLAIAAPVLMMALTYFLTRTRLGLAVRASASDADNARLSSISPGLVSAGIWGIVGVISTITAVFFLGNPPADPTTSVMGTNMLLPALAAAAIGAFTSLPKALAGGVVIGVLQQVMLWSPVAKRYDDLALLVVLTIALLLSRRVHMRGERLGSWTAVAAWRPLPPGISSLWLLRNLGRIIILMATATIIYLAVQNTASAQLWTTTILVAVIALTVMLITGLAGELSLGQFGFALLGGGVSIVIVRATGNFFLGLIAAALVTGAVSLVLAYPSLRARGASLMILTLTFAVAVPSSFLADPNVLGRGIAAPGQPIIGDLVISTGVPYFVFAAIIVTVCSLIAWNVWRGGFGRKVRAARDNEWAAESFGVAVLGTRMTLLGITGVLAGLAGAVLMHSYATVSMSSFPLDTNIRVVLAAVMGGLGILIGGPLGVLWLFTSAVAQSLTASGANLAAQQAASLAIYSSALILILIAPGGAAQILYLIRDLIAIGIARLYGRKYSIGELKGEKRFEDTDPTHPSSSEPEKNSCDPSLESDGISRQESIAISTDGESVTAPLELRAMGHPILTTGRPILQCDNLSLNYGSTTVVDGLNLSLGQGEILGLIGPNGAGKTSTFELITGFATPTTGRIALDDIDVTDLSPHRRARKGLIRSFQDAQLFPTMTTLEVIQLALERQHPTNTTASILGIDLTARRRAVVAESVVEFFGLSSYRESQINELSTGTRRFVELAALVSMRPRVLLLDEPSTGIAQRESEALGPLLKRLGKEFSLSMIIIEHDVPLVMSLSDRILVMEQGRELCVGPPDQIRADPRVVDAYMGGTLETIERSDQPTNPVPERDNTAARPSEQSSIEGVHNS